MKIPGTWVVLPAIVLTCCFSHCALAGPMPMPRLCRIDLTDRIVIGKIVKMGPLRPQAGKTYRDCTATLEVRETLKGKPAKTIDVTVAGWVEPKGNGLGMGAGASGPPRVCKVGDDGIWFIKPRLSDLAGLASISRRDYRETLADLKKVLAELNSRKWSKEVNGLRAWAKMVPYPHHYPRRSVLIFAVQNTSKKKVMYRALWRGCVLRLSARDERGQVWANRAGGAQAALLIRWMDPQQVAYVHPEWSYILPERHLPALPPGKYSLTVTLESKGGAPDIWKGKVSAPPVTLVVPAKKSPAKTQPSTQPSTTRSAAADSPQARPAGWSDPIKGLRVRLVCDRGKFIVGKPIHVRLDLECTRVQPKGKAGCQLFPHVSFRLAKVTRRVKLPIKNRLVVLKGKTFSRHFDVTKIYSLARPGRYVFVAGHENQTVEDIGDWTGDVQSPPLTIEVLGDTPGNRKAVERAAAGVWVAAVTGRHPQVPFSERTIMARAQVTGDLHGRDVCSYPWSKDGPPNVLRLDWSKKIGTKGKKPSVLVTLHTDRPQPGEQSNAQVMRFYAILGQDRYLPRIELPIEFAGFSPLTLLRHEGHDFVWVYVDRKGGGESWILHLDGRTVRSIPSEDPGGKLAALLKENERFNKGTRPAPAHYRHDEKGTRRFPSCEKVFRRDARGRTHEVARIEVVYRLEKDVSGRPVRLVADKADRKELLSGRALAPAELGRLCAKIEKNGPRGYQLHRIDWRQIPAEHKDRILKAITTEQMQRDKHADVAMVRALSWFDDEFVFQHLSVLADSASAHARCLVCEHLPYREPFAARATALLERLLQEKATGGRYSVPRAAFATLSRMATKRARQLSVRYFLRHVEPHSDYRRVVYGQTAGWRAFLQKQEGAVAVPWLVRLAASEDQRVAQSAKSDLWWFASHRPELKQTAYDAMDDPPGWLKANEKRLRPWIESAKNLPAQLEAPRRPDKAGPAATQPATTRRSSSQAQPATKAAARIREVHSL